MSTTIEKILNELQEVGKVTALNIADSLGLEPGVAVAMLKNQVKQGNADCVNGYFSITEKGRKYSPDAIAEKPVTKKKSSRAVKTQKVAEVTVSGRIDKPVQVGSVEGEKPAVEQSAPLPLIINAVQKVETTPAVIFADPDTMTVTLPTIDSLSRKIRQHEGDVRRLRKLRETVRKLQRQTAGVAL